MHAEKEMLLRRCNGEHRAVDIFGEAFMFRFGVSLDTPEVFRNVKETAMREVHAAIEFAKAGTSMFPHVAHSWC
jgi:hypothetical protein